MRKILWISCGLLLLSGCVQSYRVVNLPNFSHVPALEKRIIFVNYNPVLCHAPAHRKDIVVIAPIIEDGLRRRGAVVAVETENSNFDLQALVCVTRINGRSNVLGNLYAYHHRAVVHVRIVDLGGRILASSVGEYGFSGDGRSCFRCNGAWVGTFKAASKIAIRTLK